MKTRFSVLFISLVIALIPSVAMASWWNPFTWKAFQKKTESTLQNQATTTSDTSSTTSYALPSPEELLKRISELEDKLDKARSQKEVIVPKTETVSVKSEPVSAGLTESQIIARVKPAIVSIDTATSSGSGVIIDAQGHILVSAHNVWIVDNNNVVIRSAEEANVTFSNGTKKKAILVGIDEANDVAVLQLSDKKASNYIKINHDSGIKLGDKSYVFSIESAKGWVTGGSTFVGGSVSSLKKTGVVEINSELKPLDNGGAMVNDQGGLIGIPNKSACKVIEEMTNCLKYTITANIVRASLPKLLAGMRLYKNNVHSTEEALMVHGQLNLVYGSIKNSGIINSAITNVTGENNFDYFNSKLGSDKNSKFARLYLFKLKASADKMYYAMDILKTQSYNLHLFLINEKNAHELLGDYQRKILNQINLTNEAKLKEYEGKVASWSLKRKEYDSHSINPSGVTHDYLMEQGLIVEAEAEYLTKEQNRMLDTFSGENVNIF